MLLAAGPTACQVEIPRGPDGFDHLQEVGQ
jgi:hypothetical protein